MNENEAILRKTRKRSTSYPAFNLADVVEATKELKEKLGDGPYSREHIATALGYKAVTGSSGMKISSCVHFGLLERNGNAYSQSELARRLFNYYDEGERKNILLEAFSRPALYSKLLGEYTGKSLPLMLESILVRNYGIQENAAKAAAVNFRESAEFVGALKNGVISLTGVGGGIVDGFPTDKRVIKSIGDTAPCSSGALQHIQQTSVVDNGYLSVNLPSGIIVSYSQDLASAFAFGIFGQQLMALDKAIANHKISQLEDIEVDKNELIDEG